jgi:hypothetical protein
MRNHNQELLTFAAKAIGQGPSGTYYAAGGWSPSTEQHFKPSSGIGGGCDTSGWDPLNDDGDCARLESALMLSVVWGESEVSIHYQGDTLSRQSYAMFGGDRNMARRHATVNAAALIGGAMA